MKDYKIVHFSDDFTMEDINEAMEHQDEILYFTREIAEKNEFHIVNHKNGEFTVTQFVSQLFNFYQNDKNLSKIVSEAKVKGNDSFTVVINANEDLINQIKKDLNILLKR